MGTTGTGVGSCVCAYWTVAGHSGHLGDQQVRKNIFKKRKYFSKIFRAGVSREHRVESPIYVLFNPWLPDDPTHMSRWNLCSMLRPASVPKREEDVSLMFSGNIFPWDISLRLMNQWTLHAVRGRGGSTWWRRRARSTLGLLQNPAAGAFVKEIKRIHKTMILMSGYLQTVGVRAILPNSASSSLPSSSHSSLP